MSYDVNGTTRCGWEKLTAPTENTSARIEAYTLESDSFTPISAGQKNRKIAVSTKYYFLIST